MTEYETLRQRHARRYAELQPEYIDRISWQRERIDAGRERQQTGKLKRFVPLSPG